MEQEVHDGVHGEMRLAVASSADTPRAVEIGKAAMKILEVMTHRVRTIDVCKGYIHLHLALPLGFARSCLVRHSTTY